MRANPLKVITSSLLVLCSLIGYRQSAAAVGTNYTISGILIKEGDVDEGVEFAVVGVFRKSDSSLAAGTVSDYKGAFTIMLKEEGDYYLRANCVGYDPCYVSTIKFSKTVAILGKITMKPSANLQEVEIVDERPAYQIEEDKRVYHVDKDPVSLSGSTADVLQNIPSVFVDLDGNIKLRGGNVRILINGKPSGMLGISRKDILNLLPANMIERIEVMTNPSSQYDASGESGIINIILKKPKRAGLNEYFTGSIGTADKYNGSGTLSYRTKKWSVSLSDDFRAFDMIGNVERWRETDKTVTTYQTQRNDWTDHDISNTLRARAEYDLDSNTTITASSSYRQGKSIESKFGLYQFTDAGNIRYKVYDRNAPEDGRYHSVDAAAGISHQFHRKGQQLSADFSYSNSKERTLTDIRQSYFDPITLAPFTSNPQVDQIDDNGLQNRNLIQVDYNHPLGKQAKLETGIRRNYRYSDMDYLYSSYDWNLQKYYTIPQYTNHYRQAETVSAGYITYRNKYRKFSYRGGLRLEQTTTLAKLDTLDGNGNLKTINYTNDYLNFFPSVHVLQKLKSSQSLSFSYSRRINRPGVRELNPFYKFIDATTVRTGNPYLTPEFTNSFELSHTKNWKNATLNSSLYYRSTTNSIHRISQLDQNNVAVTTYRNFNFDRDIGGEVYITGQIAKWYRINLGVNAYNTVIDGKNISDTLISNTLNWNAKVNNVFMFGKSWVIQLAGNYVAPVVTPLFKSHEIYYSDISVRRDLMGRKLTLSLRLNDIFYTRKQVSEQFNSVYQVYTTSQRQSRILYFGIVFRPSLKKAKTEEKDDYDGSDSDEKDADER